MRNETGGFMCAFSIKDIYCTVLHTHMHTHTCAHAHSHRPTHLLRTGIANSDVECIVRAKALQLNLTGIG